MPAAYAAPVTGNASNFSPVYTVTSTLMSNLSPATMGAPNKVASCDPVIQSETLLHPSELL